MLDAIVLVAPVALLALVLLFRFVGCAFDSSGLLDGSGWDYDGTLLAHPSLVSYWRLGEAVGPTATDEKAVNPGTYETVTLAVDGNSPATASPPVLNFGAVGLIVSDPARTSLQVDGGFVSVPFNATLNTAAFAIEAWVFPEWAAADPLFFRAVLASRDAPAGVVQGFNLYAGRNSGDMADTNIYWQVWLGGGGADWQRLLGPVVELGQATHLAATYDGATLKLYVNGSEDETGTPDAQMAAAYTPNAAQPLFIGMGAPELADPRFPFKGRIQEVAVYNAALSATDIDNHVVAGSTTGP